MTTENKQLQRKISEEFARGNVDFFEVYLAEDITWNIIGSSPVKGKDEVLEVVKMLQLESFPVVTIKNIVSEGEYVVVESEGKATTKQGKPYNQTYCDVVRFLDEKVHQITTYLDTSISKQALGDN